MWTDVRWDDWNTAHVARHGIREEKVEDVVLDRGSLRLRSRAGTYVVLGFTSAGRHLVVVVASASGGEVYPITARPMTASDRRR